MSPESVRTTHHAIQNEEEEENSRFVGRIRLAEGFLVRR
jgi:hypothetical protein